MLERDRWLYKNYGIDRECTRLRRMLLTCPGVGAAPMIRMPDALEANIQKATDLGAVGIIVPTVDDALEARDAARFSRFPPTGRRS